ncbi:MAG: protein kinase [Crocinitomicaceae bacterium]|nr:protein kinase [Crocinitomicaceae bacterium]
MLTVSGVIKLTDFGIAKNIDGTNNDYTGTGTGMVLGTPKYMNPEQVRNTKDVTAQSDIYSLGVVLWEMVTGKVPYDINTESTFDVFRKIVDEPLAKTGTKWDGVIKKATKKESGERRLELKFEQPKLIEKPKTPELTQGKKSKDTKFIIGAIVVGVFVVLFGVWLDTKDKNNKVEVLDVEMATNEEIPEWKKEFEKKWDEAVATEPFNNAKTNYKHFYNLPELPDSAIEEKQRVEEKKEYYYDKILAENPDLFIDKRDGKIYQSVRIGNQTWMAENLAYKPSYGNYWAYDDDISNVAKYGYLYDWKTACKVCPDGWHLPSDDEWTRLAEFLGGAGVAGHKMKNSNGWVNSRLKGNGSNESGFNGLPGGYRESEGSYQSIYQSVLPYGVWWSSSISSVDGAWNRYLDSEGGSLGRGDGVMIAGFSIRCIKD